MSPMENQDQSQGIKLFGTTITLHAIQSIKKEENPSDREEVHDPTAEKRPDKIIPCPRCKSMETKFCYFNNYNVNQPRHFCKGCQRYWTAGGALRNVPVGAGRRKSKPPCPDENGGSLYDSMSIMAEEWCMAAQGGFRHAFPVKRRRSSSSGGLSC